MPVTGLVHRCVLERSMVEEDGAGGGHSRGGEEHPGHPGFTDTALQTSVMSGRLLLPFIISSC